MKNDLERLRKIADSAYKVTKADKSYLNKLKAELGIVHEVCNTCPNAYKDLAVVIYAELTKGEPQDSDAAYVLNDGVDVIYKGYRVNAATLTDEYAAFMIGIGFPKSFFKSLPNED